LSDPDDFDIKSHVWAYKKQREIVRKMKFFDGEIPSQHPAFPNGSTAAVGSEDIIYSPQDDLAIETFLRSSVTSVFHGLGTCRMAPEDELGVVDESLSVHGLKQLKIADMSIVPGNVAATTMNTALLIGEKAADIIIRELGL
jgi:alcohol oxidase